MRSPRSLPPELIATTKRAQQAAALDPIKILSQEANRTEIDHIGTDEWITLYKLEDSKCGSKCYFCALVPEKYLIKAMDSDSWDLMIGNGLPGFTRSNVSGRTRTRYERFGSSSVEPLIHKRFFHGLKPPQFDLLDEFRHFHNLYHDRRNDRYISVDERGEDDIVVQVFPNHVMAKTRHVRQFMAARALHLAVYFDHRAEADVDIAIARARLPDESVNRGDLRFSFHVADLSGRAFSRLVGKKIISPLPIKQCGVWPYETRRRQFTDYIIGVDVNGRNVMHTGDEEALGNYFGRNPSAPHFLTPVWFRREVLRKYYDHPEKFDVEDGYLRRGSLWGLQIDNNLPNHVVVYLGDLGSLAYEEQLYWKSFNLPPAADRSSETNFRRSFLAEFTDPTAPDLVFKERLVGLQEAWESVSPS